MDDIKYSLLRNSCVTVSRRAFPTTKAANKSRRFRPRGLSEGIRQCSRKRPCPSLLGFCADSA